MNGVSSLVLGGVPCPWVSFGPWCLARGGANAKDQGRRTTSVKGRTKNQVPRTKDGRLHRIKNCASVVLVARVRP